MPREDDWSNKKWGVPDYFGRGMPKCGLLGLQEKNEWSEASAGEFRALACCVVSLLSIRKFSMGVLFQKRHPRMLADSGRHSAQKTSFSRMSRRVALPEPTSFDFSGHSNKHCCSNEKSVLSQDKRLAASFCWAPQMGLYW